jgi:hypothetical protein
MKPCVTPPGETGMGMAYKRWGQKRKHAIDSHGKGLYNDIVG